VSIGGLLCLARVTLFLSEGLLFGVFVRMGLYLGMLAPGGLELGGLDRAGRQFSSVCLVVISRLVPVVTGISGVRISFFIYIALAELITRPVSVTEYGLSSCLVLVLCVHLFHVGLCHVLSLLWPSSFLCSTYVHRVDVLWVLVLSSVSGL